MNYVMTDIHNHNKEWISMLEKIKFNPQNDKLFILGDLFDRGDEAIEVWETYKRLKKDKCVVALKGNHDVWLADALEKYLLGFSDNSYYETLDILLENMSKSEMKILINEIYGWYFQVAVEVNDTRYLMAHARTYDPEYEIQERMYWFYGAYDEYENYFIHGINDYISIIGHNAQNGNAIRNEKGNVILLDAGIGEWENGRLACMCLENQKMWYV